MAHFLARRATGALEAVMDRLNKHIGLGSDHGDTSDSDAEVEVEGFDSEGNQKELADILPYLKMAMAAYKNKSMAEKFSFVSRSKLIQNLEKPTVLTTTEQKREITTDTEVHVCVLEDGSLVFAFRGTETKDWTDWRSVLGDLMTDLMKDQIQVELYDASDDNLVEQVALAPSIKVHQGFQLAFQDVTKTPRRSENIRLVAEELGAHASNVKRVICCGHSLGGALATLCAHWCRYVGYKKADVWCVTIGSPRVGNRAFAENFNRNVVTKGRSYRMVNKGDLVPNIPRFDSMLNVLSPYKHVEGFLYLTEDPTDKEVITLKRGGRRPSFHLRSFHDHHCRSYKESINRALAAVSYVQHRSISLP